MKYGMITFAAGIAISVNTAALAAVINVNIATGGGNNHVGVTLDGTAYAASVSPASYTGTTWNDIGGDVSGTALLDSDGNPTTVDVSADNGGNSAFFGWGNPNVTTDVLENYTAVHNGFGGALVGPATITISGLAANGAYDLHFVSLGDDAGQGGSFTIGGDTKTAAATDASNSVLTEGDNFVSFTNVLADGTGEVSVTWTTLTGSGFGVLNGFQIVEVPEPASLALIGGGLLALASRRRRD